MNEPFLESVGSRIGFSGSELSVCAHNSCLPDGVLTISYHDHCPASPIKVSSITTLLLLTFLDILHLLLVRFLFVTGAGTLSFLSARKEKEFVVWVEQHFTV